MVKNNRNKINKNQSHKRINEREFIKIHKTFPRNAHQQEYLEAIEDNVITVGIGLAGTGKTFLSVYSALCHHWTKTVKRIIITRPAIESGEKLGFLPGDLSDKLDPYMRPIYDALYDHIGLNLTKEKIERGYIEIAPLNFMRGRNFKNCFIILDEAQNATLEQLKMCLTRLGDNCKLVIVGDPSQSDLRYYKANSGLVVLESIIKDIKNIKVIKFDKNDIVRSPVVIDIVQAFEDYENENTD